MGKGRKREWRAIRAGSIRRVSHRLELNAALPQVWGVCCSRTEGSPDAKAPVAHPDDEPAGPAGVAGRDDGGGSCDGQKTFGCRVFGQCGGLLG